MLLVVVSRSSVTPPVFLQMLEDNAAYRSFLLPSRPALVGPGVLNGVVGMVLKLLAYLCRRRMMTSEQDATHRAWQSLSSWPGLLRS